MNTVIDRKWTSEARTKGQYSLLPLFLEGRRSFCRYVPIRILYNVISIPILQRYQRAKTSPIKWKNNGT